MFRAPFTGTFKKNNTETKPETISEIENRLQKINLEIQQADLDRMGFEEKQKEIGLKINQLIRDEKRLKKLLQDCEAVIVPRGTILKP